ncbi:MAG TPA: Fe-S cluster assembly protein SufD [Woeseiaceae bacterium]|nr:Fe-S cluster assembly protein SufD [Woeseiaceae bacterium]
MRRSGIDTDLLERVVGSLPPDGLTPARRRALECFRDAGFPTVRQEEWKYTNLAPAVDVSNRWLREIAVAAPEAGLSESARECAETLALQIDAHWIVVANGIVQRDSLAELAALAPAVGLSSAAEGGEMETLPAVDAMSLFNAILLRDALHVRIAPDALLERPIGLLVFDEARDARSVSLPRIVVEAGAGARASIVEVHASAGEHDQFTNALTEVELAPGAALSWLRLQERQAAHYQVGRLNLRAGRDASFDHAAFDLGGGLVRNDVAVDIREPGAAIALHGLYLAGGHQHIDNHTRVDHRVGPARSTEEYRGILNDRARCVFNGKALVHAGADGTDAHQANHNLLLSQHAEVDTKPELEIYADDVKCSHGATVGQLDEAALFYLRTRGLSTDEAARALTRAFATAIVSRCPVREARDYVERAVETRLQEMISRSPVGRATAGSARTEPAGARTARDPNPGSPVGARIARDPKPGKPAGARPTGDPNPGKNT